MGQVLTTPSEPPPGRQPVRTRSGKRREEWELSTRSSQSHRRRRSDRRFKDPAGTSSDVRSTEQRGIHSDEAVVRRVKIESEATESTELLEERMVRLCVSTHADEDQFKTRMEHQDEAAVWRAKRRKEVSHGRSGRGDHRRRRVKTGRDDLLSPIPLDAVRERTRSRSPILSIPRRKTRPHSPGPLASHWRARTPSRTPSPREKVPSRSRLRSSNRRKVELPTVLQRNIPSRSKDRPSNPNPHHRYHPDRYEDYAPKRTSKRNSTTLTTHIPPPEIKRKECTICTDERAEHHFPLRSATKECTHPPAVCKRCLRQWITTQFETKVWNQITCPECPNLLEYADVALSAPSRVFKRYDVLSTRAALEEIPGFTWCLAKDCSSGQVHEDPSAAPRFACVNCKARFCLTHGVKWHKGETCAEYDYRTDGKTKKMEDDASKALIKELAKKCPNPNGKCKWMIEKNNGCDHMTCEWTFLPYPVFCFPPLFHCVFS